MEGSLSQLESLQELDLSGNRLASLQDIEQVVTKLPRLKSLKLEGNPVTALLPTGAARQLARPATTLGKTPAQVIADILRQDLAPSAPPPLAAAASVLSDGVTAISGGADALMEERGQKAPDLDSILAGNDTSSMWRQEQRALKAEIESLRARVKELEEGGAESSPDSRGGRPSWLAQNSNVSLSATLPSRRAGLTTDDEASELRSQLKEEQRKSKRLEKEVQRLTDRTAERELSSGAVGSVPHFEFDDGVELGDLLSQGGFSVVHKGAWHGTRVAIKKLFDPNITQELLAEFDNEVAKLEQIRHPNILLLLAVHRKPPALSMISELVEGGSLFQLLHQTPTFNAAAGPMTGCSLPQLIDIMEVSAGAITFLHGRGIVHRDIKSHNVLLSPHLEVKICDFGLARMRSELNTGAMQFAGTPSYMAPEMFRQQKYSETVDTFAFGTLLWEVAAGDIPWANMDPPDIRDRVLEGRMLAIPRTVPRAMQKLIQDSWIMDRHQRPAMSVIFAGLEACPRDGAGGGARRPGIADVGAPQPTGVVPLRGGSAIGAGANVLSFAGN